MNTTPLRPTFGQVRQFLLGLDFVEESLKPGIAAFRQDSSGAVFLFRNRDPESPARESEFYELELQLTYRGVVSDADFARFVTSNAAPTPAS